jgi:hypothetical protein
MLAGSGAITHDVSKELLQESGVIHKMLSKSINTAKSNLKKNKHISN